MRVVIWQVGAVTIPLGRAPMLVLKVGLSALLIAAGLFGTFRPVTSADRAFASPLYHRIGFFLTTVFLLLILWH